MSTTGIVSQTCARHSTFLPGATVDLQKGERCVLGDVGMCWRLMQGCRYMNVDYSMAQALLPGEDIPRKVVCYDLACQYSKKFPSRFERRFPLVSVIIGIIIWVVGKMHGQGHQESCQYEHGMAFCPGMARTDGEGPERPWQEFNLLSGSTREMSAPNRHETISDCQNHWNFVKRRDMGEWAGYVGCLFGRLICFSCVLDEEVHRSCVVCRIVKGRV